MFGAKQIYVVWKIYIFFAVHWNWKKRKKFKWKWEIIWSELDCKEEEHMCLLGQLCEWADLPLPLPQFRGKAGSILCQGVSLQDVTGQEQGGKTTFSSAMAQLQIAREW